SPAAPDLYPDAPSFEGIGSRRDGAWIARWIQDAKALRSVARMPKVLHGDKVKEEAESIAAYLVSLKDGSSVTTSALEPTTETIEGGHHLFETLHCAACHLAPDSTEMDPLHISLKWVRQKFSPGALAAF